MELTVVDRWHNRLKSACLIFNKNPKIFELLLQLTVDDPLLLNLPQREILRFGRFNDLDVLIAVAPPAMPKLVHEISILLLDLLNLFFKLLLTIFETIELF